MYVPGDTTRGLLGVSDCAVVEQWSRSLLWVLQHVATTPTEVNLWPQSTRPVPR